MSITKKWRTFIGRRKLKKAIKKYNKALTSFSKATDEIANAMMENGRASNTLLNSLKQLKEFAANAVITPQDLRRGGGSNGKR